MKVCGIDPSLCSTGWGVIEVFDEKISHVAHGTIKPSLKLTTENRLAFLSFETDKLMDLYQPDIICIEETYCGVNPITTLRLGFASGALLSTFGLRKLSVLRYPARLVKFLVTNKGNANKDEVRNRVIDILSLQHSIQSLDASDALAVAIAYVMQNTTQGR